MASRKADWVDAELVFHYGVLVPLPDINTFDGRSRPSMIFQSDHGRLLIRVALFSLAHAEEARLSVSEHAF